MPESPGLPAHALQGVHVLDFGWAIVGAITGRNLATQGATVIRIESLTRPDAQRTNRHIARSASNRTDDKPWPVYLNTSKLHMQLNLKHPRARGIVHRLATWADVVCANFTPG